MQAPILSRFNSDPYPPAGQSVAPSIPTNAALGLALEHGLGLPLSALRASMESIQRGLSAGTLANVSLHEALEEVDLIGRNIHDLMDLAVPPSPMPLRCTPLEIASSARGSLRSELIARVLLVDMCDARSVHMDAPIVAACLQRLLANAFEASNEFVLLTLRSDEQHTHFTVVDGSPSSFDAAWALAAFHSDKRHHMGLGLALVERDMALVNGSFSIKRTGNAETMATLSVPNTLAARAKRSDLGEQRGARA